VRDDAYAVRAAISAGIRCYVVTPDEPTGMSAPITRIRPRGASPDELSGREVEVLQLVSEGRSNKEIGDALGLSALTVKSHLARIARKIGTGDRAEMVAHAMRSGLVR
jgi:DNA-binding NarL/FixJ family response regulator